MQAWDPGASEIPGDDRLEPAALGPNASAHLVPSSLQLC